MTKQNRQRIEADNQKIDTCISDFTLSYHKDTEMFDTSVILRKGAKMPILLTVLEGNMIIEDKKI